VNCLIERRIDAIMARTRGRPLPRGEVDTIETFLFSAVIGGCGLLLLHAFVNPLTMWLTLATFIGYALIYTVILKPLTPQNIVIGGASGAMPPVLGWAAATGQMPEQAWLLFLIIFLSGRRRISGRWPCTGPTEYAAASMPMLPVVHGPGIHPAQHLRLHAGAGRGELAALRHRHERRDLSLRGGGAERGIHRSRVATLAPLQRRQGAGHVPLLDRLPVAAVLCAAGGPLPAPLSGESGISRKRWRRLRMKATLKLFATLQDYLPAEAKKSNSVQIELADTTTVADLIERFRLPDKLCHLVLVDGNYIPPAGRAARVIRDGEVLSIWPPVAGG
jgi:sulfur carrier protein ThiS